MSKTIDSEIQSAIGSTQPFTRARQKALAQLKWVISDDDGHYLIAGVDTQFTGDKSQASVYDGRDNQEMKLRFFRAVTGRALRVELI